MRVYYSKLMMNVITDIRVKYFLIPIAAMVVNGWCLLDMLVFTDKIGALHFWLPWLFDVAVILNHIYCNINTYNSN